MWIKSLHSLAYNISVAFSSRSMSRRIVNPNGVAIQRFDPTSLDSLRKIWPLIEFISVLPWILTRVYLPIMLGFFLVADRYVVDTVVTISIRLKEKDFYNTFIGRVLLKMIPDATAIVLLDIGVDTVLKRRYDVEYTFEEILDQIALYRKLAKSLGALIINSEKLDAKNVLMEITNEFQLA